MENIQQVFLGGFIVFFLKQQNVFNVFFIVFEWVLVSKDFYSYPYLGKITILTNIFQMGGSTTYFSRELQARNCTAEGSRLESMKHGHADSSYKGLTR